jgi:methyl-accepting chemotaxis protein
MLIFNLNAAIDFTAHERMGVVYVRSLKPLLEKVAQHRGQVNAYLTGDRAMENSFPQTRQAIDAAFDALVSADRSLGATLKTGSKVESLRGKWESIQANALKWDAPTAFQEHTALIQATLNLIAHVAETSELILDPALDSYYLMDAMTTRLPSAIEALGQTRGFGAGAISRNNWDAETLIRLHTLRNTFADAEKAWSTGLRASFRANAAIEKDLGALNQAASASVAGFLQTIARLLLDRQSIQISPDEFFQQGTQAIDASWALFDQTAMTLDKLLVKRLAFDRVERNAALATLCLVVALQIVIFTAMYRGLANTIRDLVAGAQQLASGDLTTRIPIRAQDETRTVVENFNAMAEQFQKVVGQIVRATHQAASTASQLSTTSTRTTHEIIVQRQEIEQVTRAVEEMSAAAHQVAVNAEGAARAATEADQEAANGQQAVQDVVVSVKSLVAEIMRGAGVVHELAKDTKSIGAILEVIQRIAEQTNLLALNAAIEAARAGEHGRGFAVVADEVRTLANQTQGSAGEIQEMIRQLQEKSRQAVEVMTSGRTEAGTGLEKVRFAGDCLEKITRVVTGTVDRNHQIASAAEEQSAVAEEITRSVCSINDVAERNSQGAYEISDAAKGLAKLAEGLESLTRQFKFTAAG